MDHEKFSNSTNPLGPISEKQNYDVDKELSPSPPPEVSLEKDDEPDLEDGDDLERIKTEEYPGPLRLSLTVLALAFSIFLVALDLTIVATAIPRITDDFHSLNQVGWYGSAFFLTVASFQSTWGKADKYFPLKTGFLVSVFVFEVGSLICGVSKNSTTLIVRRAVAGSGGAGVASGVYYHGLFCSTETAGSIHWSHWSSIWHGFCCWTPPGKSLTPLPRLLHQIPNKVSSDRGASSRIISLGASVSTSIYRSEAWLVASYSSSSRRQPLLNLLKRLFARSFYKWTSSAPLRSWPRSCVTYSRSSGAV
jgi:hypothetical protein